MTATDLDRWAADQAAYGSPDYVRGYRDGIDDAVQAAKDLDTLVDRSWWTNQGHGAVIRILHQLDPAAGSFAAISYLGSSAKWWPPANHALLARAADSTLRLRQSEERDLRADRSLARAQYLTEHGVAW